METGFDNANNPFGISNGGGAAAAPTDNLISTAQKDNGLLLSLTDNFKHNGDDMSPITTDFCEKPIKSLASTFWRMDNEDEAPNMDEGPETDVDALSPIEKSPQKPYDDVFGNNNPAEHYDEGVLNPFVEHQEKAALDMERSLQKLQQQHLEMEQHFEAQHRTETQETEHRDEFDNEEPIVARDETPTPPADAVHDVGGLEENAIESESEDEWNYIKGEEANKENIEPQSEKEVAATTDEEDNMSQLNPNAAEFVPVSPTRSIPSPACRMLINDEVISQSPKRPVNVDINVPNISDFETEIKSRPSEVDTYSNGHSSDNDHSLSTPEKMENLLNGKSIDDIEEFQPGSTPQKSKPSEEFHFGPNAAPFTPVRHLDQSETGLSTKAIFGDESAATLGTTFSESVLHDATVDLMSKESDPMSMSFYADKGDINPFDLNEVQMLPDESNDSVLDAPEQNQLENITMNNDDAIQITDLDKQAYDDEKELASPLEPDVELLETTKADEGKEECDNTNIEPNNELISDFCQLSIKEPVETLPPDVELFTPEPRPHSSEPEQLIDDEQVEAVVKDDLEVQKAEVLSEKIQEQLQMDHDSEIFETKEELDPFQPEISPPKDEGVLLMSCEVDEEQASNLIESIEKAGRDEVKSPLIVDDESIRRELMMQSPVCDLPEAKSPLLCDITEKSSVCDIVESKSPIPDQVPEPQEDLIEPVQESCDYTKPELIAEANSHFEELCQPVEASITSSIKDEISSPAATPEMMEDNFSENHFVASPIAEESEKIEPGAVQQIDVKTETISPQFPEEAIVTPSEEIKDDVPTAPLVEEPVPEPSVEVSDEITTAALGASIAAVGVAAAVAAVAAPTSSLEPTSDVTEPVTPPTKRDEKKKASSVKKASATKTSTTAPKTTPRTLAAKTTTSKPSPSPKLSAPKSATKPALSGVSPKPATSSVAHKPSSASKLLTSKPKPTTATQPKPQADKKPLTNGDVKAPIKSTLLARKTVSETTTAKAARPISAAAPKPTTAAAKPTNPRPASAPRTTTGLAPKPKPATLSSRPAPTKTSTTTSATTKSSTTTAATTKTSPRPAATSTAKPRVPLSRPIGKAPDKEKQNKESANKITASKVSTTKTSGSTTVRKVESKTIGARTTVSKTSTTTMKSTTAKKPAEIIRNPSKTKTTKIEKPKENGVSTVVTEEITIVNTTNTVINGEPQLVKDNSPIDNKLLIGDNLIETNAAD